jgi:CheY-like chemotaxis protein
MLGWAKLLRSRKLDEAMTQRALETIERNAVSQTQLIGDLLDISRIMTGKLRLDSQLVELASVIRLALETVYLAAEAKQIQLEANLDPRVGPVLGDRDRLQQVVWNLLTNAIKFTPTGGQVTVSLQQVYNQIELVVQDTGQGLSPQFLPHIFERFRQADSSSTRQHGGLGLGLAIVRHLVELHGSTVQADSPGESQGSTFTVRLPLHQSWLQAQTGHQSNFSQLSIPIQDNSLQLAGLRLLVVDDEGDARQLVSTVLEGCGAIVTTAASVQAALQVLQQSQPDLLISDIGMPGEDGYALIRWIRLTESGNGKHLPAIALTAYARPEDRTAALLAGFQAFLPKPVEPGELIAAVAGLATLPGSET